METIELVRPLKVNGRDLTVLKCDMEAVTPEAFVRAEARANEKRNNEGAAATLLEVDYGFHLYLAFEGVKAADPSIDDSDLDRLRGTDLIRLMQVGRFFALGAGGGSPEEGSEGPSGSTAASTAAAPTK